MAYNLSKRVTRRPGTATPQHTFRRETTMPRQGTDRPDRGVFTRIHRPNTDNADELARILGIANKVGQDIAADIQEGKNQEAAGQAAIDFNAGEQDEKLFAKSRAYRAAWQKQTAKKTARDIGNEVSEVYNELFNDPDNPPTLEEVEASIEAVFQRHTMDETGQLLDFGTPQAKTILGNALAEVKATAMGKAYTDIAKAEDAKFISTHLDNGIFEWQRGAEIGSEVEVQLDRDPDDGNYYRDPLAPLPDKEAQPTARTVLLGKPTGRPPVKGVVTASMADHRARGSAGVDIDGQIGDPIEAPAGGKVKVGRDSASGLHVIIDHGGGVVSTYSHLDATDLKDGDVIRSGQTLGLMGNSGRVSKKNGDGSHLHWRVKVNGKDVNPLAFKFPEGGEMVAATTGEEPELLTDAPSETVRVVDPFPFEQLMADLPPSIHKGEAKKELLNGIIAHAQATKDISILHKLEDSTRKDGTPSFRPTERALIAKTRDAIRRSVREENDRIERELQSENRDRVLQAWVEGNQPSEEWMAEQSRKGLLDVGFVYTMNKAIEQEREAAERERSALAREAERREREDIAAMVYADEAAARVGLLEGMDNETLLKRWDRGEFGEGKFGAANFRRLLTAAKVGRAEAERNPQFQFYAQKLKSDYAPAGSGRTGAAGLLQQGPSGGAVDAATFAAMVAHYENQVHSGTSPAEAYHDAINKFAKKPADPSAAMNRMAYLRCKQREKCK